MTSAFSSLGLVLSEAEGRVEELPLVDELRNWFLYGDILKTIPHFEAVELSLNK